MKKSILLALLLSFGLTSFSQQTWWNITDTYQHRKILPDGQKIWIATEGGLICIDNNRGDTTYYNHANSEMPFTNIKDMCIDLQGRLWLASVGGGIASKYGETWTNYNTENTTLPTNFAYSIACDSKGNIWAGLMYYLVKYDGVSWTTYSHDSLGGKILYPSWTEFDKNDRVLFGNTGDAGIRAWDGNQFTHYKADNSPLHDNRISFVKTFPDGKTWIGYRFGGLTITDFSTWDYYDTLVPGKSLKAVYAFNRMSTGEYWLSANPRDLYTYDGNDWEEIYPASPVDSIKYINYIAVNENDKLFVAGTPNCTFDGEIWEKVITPGSGMRGNSVRSYLQASDSTTWAGNYYGITAMRNNVLTHYATDDSSSYSSADCFAEDKYGMVYVGHNYGISKFENNTWKRVNSATDGARFNMKSMCFDGDNNLWYCDWSNLIKFDGTNLTKYSWIYNNFLLNKEPYCIAVDMNGGIVCGIEKGIAVWENNKWIAKINPDAVNQNPRVSDIAVRDNIIWMSTMDGLVKYDGSEWTTYNSGNSSMPDDGVWQFDFDSKGNIWFMSGRSILVKFDGVDFETISYFESGMTWGLNNKLRIDHLDNIWMGGPDAGISIYNENGISLNLEKINAPLAHNQEIIQLAYPNPTNGELKIAYKLPANQSGGMFSITDLQGRKIDGFAISDNENTIHYSTDKLTSGLYLFSIFNSKGEGSTTKIQVIK